MELFAGHEPGPALDLAPVLAGSTWSGDLTVRRPDGAERLAAVSATPVRGDDGTVSGAVVVAEDMTEVRQAEAVAAASEQRLRLAHEAAELGSWHWDMPSGVTVWDEQLEAIYGMPPGGFGGTFEAWQRTIHPDDHDTVMRVVQEAVDARSSYVLRNRIFWPDGTMRWIEAHGKVTVDAAGNPSGTIGCVRDVTERLVLQERQADAAARALLLQEVTAALSGARTLEQVDAVVRDSLERVAEIVPPTVELRMPEDLATIANGAAFVARSQGTTLPRGRPAARHARRAVRDHRTSAPGSTRGPPTSPSSCSPAWPPARCPRSSTSSSRCTTRRAATSSSTWAATGTTPCATAVGPAGARRRAT